MATMTTTTAISRPTSEAELQIMYAEVEAERRLLGLDVIDPDEDERLHEEQAAWHLRFNPFPLET